MRICALTIVLSSIFFGLLAFSSCRKEELRFITEKESQVSTGASNRDDQMDFSPCGLQDSNSISITYRRKDGSLAPAICFSESALFTVLKNAGLSDKDVKIYLKNAFYAAKSARPALTLDIGLLIAEGYLLPADYVVDCFAMSALGRQDYPLSAAYATEMVQAIQFKGDQRTDFIDYYTIRQAHSGSGCPLVKEPGFSGVRFFNTATHAAKTVNIPSLDSLRVIFRQAGFTREETESNMAGIMNGAWSIFAVWNLFQTKLVPVLPAVKEIKFQPNAKNWRLSQIGIGLYASDASIESFYYARGDAKIE